MCQVKPVQHYQVDALLYAGEYPGSFAPELAVTRLRELLDKGVRTFIDLTSPADLLDPYEGAFSTLDPSAELGLRRYSHPIPDLGIPTSPEAMRAILGLLRDETSAGRVCYIHCWAGIGRTGTVIGCWLREKGLDAKTALDEVQRRYFTSMEKSALYPRSPQTPAQTQYIKDWQPGT